MKMCENCKIEIATAVIRTHDVCGGCFNKIKKDNQERITEGKSIPNKLVLLGDEKLLREHERQIRKLGRN